MSNFEPCRRKPIATLLSAFVAANPFVLVYRNHGSNFIPCALLWLYFFLRRLRM